MYSVDSLISELRKFSEEIISFGDPVTDNRILDFEEINNVILPNDFKEFVSKCNGIDLMGSTVYGFYPNEKKESIESVYQFEHYEVNYPQFSYLVPFSSDGRGNFYCFDTRALTANSSKIVFWVSNYIYNDTDKPEVVNDSFLEWLKEVVIDWTLEDYDYDGNEK